VRDIEEAIVTGGARRRRFAIGAAASSRLPLSRIFAGAPLRPPPSPARGEGLFISFLFLTLLAACHGKADDKERVTPSGLPVPRYVSLKFDPVNARAGPSDDHRLLWVYHARGLPVQVIAETVEWRRICDPDGQVSWVHKRTTDGRRTVMQAGQGAIPLRAKPRDDGAVVAYLAPRAVADFDKCQKDWCRVRIGQADGWAPAGAFWGVTEAPQCPKPAPSAGSH
jgi:SH3-like domain-containing protein